MIIRVLTYNIHHAEGIDQRIDPSRIQNVIRESSADIVGLNEVHHPTQTIGHDESLLPEVARALGMRYAFGAALPRGGRRAPPFPYGNALLSRFPLSGVSSYLLPSASGREVRGLLAAELKLASGAALTCYVTHLENQEGALRRAQSKAALDIIGQRGDHPHIILGDFNCAGPESPLFQQEGAISRMLREGYADAQAMAGNAGVATWATTQPSVRIDYIWLSPELRASVIECAPWRSELSAVASDHFPVLAELELGM